MASVFLPLAHGNLLDYLYASGLPLRPIQLGGAGVGGVGGGAIDIGMEGIASILANSLYDSRPVKNVVDEKGIINVFSLDNLDITFDFAIISNPTHLHFEYIQLLAKKNIPLFIEKPAVHSLDNIDELISLIESKKLMTYVACNLRFHPCILFINKYIKTVPTRINEVNVYCGSYMPDWRPGKDFRKIYSANESMGGGVHLDLFHELDYITWIFGQPIKSRSTKRSVSSLEINAVDYANYCLEYNSFTANIVLNYYRRNLKRTIEIVIDNQIINVDLVNNIVSNDNDQILFQISNFEMRNTYKNQMEYFIHCLKQNERPMNSLKESIEILKIVLQNE
jgi:predicted dehydrogenase